MPVPTRFGFMTGQTYDTFFKNVILLAHGTGANAANNNTFLDSSANALTLTKTGNPGQGSFDPYATIWSTYFPGSAYLSAPNNAGQSFGSGDFTVECWSLPQSLAGTPPLMSRWNSTGTAGTNQWILYCNGTTPTFVVSTDGSANTYAASGAAIQVGTWNHIAAVRSSGTLTVYVNGVGGTGVSAPGSLFSTDGQALEIAAYQGGAVTSAGHISNARIVKGVAVYTGNFTPPTSPLTAIAGTTFLLNSNRYLDTSASALAITTSGSPQISPLSPFSLGTAYSTANNGGSGYFDGASYITVPAAATNNLGTGNFTIEAWVFPSALSGTPQIVDLWTNSSGSFITGQYQVGLDASGHVTFTVATGASASSTFTTTSTIKALCWNHLAIVRSGTTITCYINGVADATTLTSSAQVGQASGAGSIGRQTSSNTLYFTGHVSDVRTVSGTAIYTTGFTPPTAPLSAVTNTQLLVHGTNGAIFDQARGADLATLGTAAISTSQQKFGAGSMSFPGSATNAISIPAGLTNMLGSADFTLEGWVYPSSFTGSPAIWDAWAGASGSFVTGQWSVSFDTSGHVVFTVATGLSTTVSVTTATAVSLTTWTFIAVVRSSGVIKVYLNGTADANTLSSSVMVGQTSAAGSLGRETNPVGNYFNGFMQDVRYTRGVARYTTNFTSPTSLFPNQ